MRRKRVNSVLNTDGEVNDFSVSQRKVNWSQEDVERLAQLLLQYGRDGILNKQTNGATNLRKKHEWAIVGSHFNSDPLVRKFNCFFWRVCASFSIFLTIYFQNSCA